MDTSGTSADSGVTHMRIAPARVLDFDCESRPLSYWADRPSAEITAIAWSWNGERKISCALLGEVTVPEILQQFVDAYNQADIVTGHYIRRFDLPLVNGQLLEQGMPCLEPKLASDTKSDLVRRLDLPVSQEALAAYLGIRAPKIHMTQHDWRDANRLTPTGLQRTAKRVIGDVRQHKQMRAELLRRELLGPPKRWAP